MMHKVSNQTKTPKPLTLDEVLNSTDVLLELRRDNAMEWHLGAILSAEISTLGTLDAVSIMIDTDNGVTGGLSADRYGKDWRCWNYSDLIRAMETTPWT